LSFSADPKYYAEFPGGASDHKKTKVKKKSSQPCPGAKL